MVPRCLLEPVPGALPSSASDKNLLFLSPLGRIMNGVSLFSLILSVATDEDLGQDALLFLLIGSPGNPSLRKRVPSGHNFPRD